MKHLSIKIDGNRITVDPQDTTLLEAVRAVSGMYNNLNEMLPTPKMSVDESGRLTMVMKKTHTKRGKGAAMIVVAIGDDGFVCGGEVEHKGQDTRHVVQCLEYVYSQYAKKLAAIAEQLWGKDEGKQCAWMEEILNRPTNE